MSTERARTSEVGQWSWNCQGAWAAALKLRAHGEPCREHMAALVCRSELKPQKELEESRAGVNWSATGQNYTSASISLVQQCSCYPLLWCRVVYPQLDIFLRRWGDLAGPYLLKKLKLYKRYFHNSEWNWNLENSLCDWIYLYFCITNILLNMATPSLWCLQSLFSVEAKDDFLKANDI